MGPCTDPWGTSHMSSPRVELKPATEVYWGPDYLDQAFWKLVFRPDTRYSANFKSGYPVFRLKISIWYNPGNISKHRLFNRCIWEKTWVMIFRFGNLFCHIWANFRQKIFETILNFFWATEKFLIAYKFIWNVSKD